VAESGFMILTIYTLGRSEDNQEEFRIVDTPVAYTSRGFFINRNYLLRHSIEQFEEKHFVNREYVGPQNHVSY
jgi:hypothetical protein